MATALVIFDCDGVLVDSDRICLRIQAEHITALGMPTTYEDCVRDFLGRTRRDRRSPPVSPPAAVRRRCA